MLLVPFERSPCSQRPYGGCSGRARVFAVGWAGRRGDAQRGVARGPPQACAPATIRLPHPFRAPLPLCPATEFMGACRFFFHVCPSFLFHRAPQWPPTAAPPQAALRVSPEVVARELNGIPAAALVAAAAITPAQPRREEGLTATDSAALLLRPTANTLPRPSPRSTRPTSPVAPRPRSALPLCLGVLCPLRAGCPRRPVLPPVPAAPAPAVLPRRAPPSPDGADTLLCVGGDAGMRAVEVGP